MVYETNPYGPRRLRLPDVTIWLQHHPQTADWGGFTEVPTTVFRLKGSLIAPRVYAGLPIRVLAAVA